MGLFQVPRLAPAVIALAALSATSARGQATKGAPDPRFFNKRFYVYVLSASHNGVPVSYDYVDATTSSGFPQTEVHSSSSGVALGGGFSWEGLGRPFLFEIGFDHITGSFTDWRVRDRRIGFNQIDLSIGYVLRTAVSLAPYMAFGLGWYHQSEYVDPRDYDIFSTPPGEFPAPVYEAMDDVNYSLLSGALGLKVGLLRYVSLRSEIRWYWEGSGGGGGSCGPNCIVVDVSDRGPVQQLGRRASAGLQLHFGLGRRQ